MQPNKTQITTYVEGIDQGGRQIEFKSHVGSTCLNRVELHQ